MEKKIVCCRREVGEDWNKKEYCNKTITTKNPLNWCDEDLKRLPIWPV